MEVLSKTRRFLTWLIKLYTRESLVTLRKNRFKSVSPNQCLRQMDRGGVGVRGIGAGQRTADSSG